MDEFDDDIENLARKVRNCNRQRNKRARASDRDKVKKVRLKREAKKRGSKKDFVPVPSDRTAGAYSLSDDGGLKVGSACTGWCAESQALTQLGVGHTLICTCDSEPDVKQYLDGNLKSLRFHHNVFSQSFSEEEYCDLLVAGFPCQPYSSEGSRGGSSDPRSKVVDPIIGYCEKKKPLMILLENVPGWETVGKDKFDEVWERLSSIRDASGDAFYNLYKTRLQSADFGSVQRRNRLYVVALSRACDIGFTWPDPLPKSLTSFDSILDAGSTIYDRFTVDDVPMDVMRTKTQRNAVADALQMCADGMPSEHLVVDIGTGRGRRVTRGYFPTITATRAKSRDFFSPQLRRRFTLTELARAQGANADEINIQSVKPAAFGKIIGNAMSVGTIKAILSQMLKCIGLLD
eukprot:s4508_g6.t1